MLFDGRTLHLARSQDVEKLRSATVAAIQSGGGVIEVAVVGEDELVSVVVSAGIPIVFESREIPDVDSQEDEERQFLDHDDWDLDG